MSSYDVDEDDVENVHRLVFSTGPVSGKTYTIAQQRVQRAARIFQKIGWATVRRTASVGVLVKSDNCDAAYNKAIKVLKRQGLQSAARLGLRSCTWIRAQR